jgi:hypothetical protein
MTNVRAALARADQRYSRRAGHDERLAAEHLDALALAVQPYLNPATDSALAATIAQQHGQITALEAERDQLVEHLAAVRADLTAARAGPDTSQLTGAPPDPDPLADLMRRVRDELRTWGSPAQLKGVA